MTLRRPLAFLAAALGALHTHLTLADDTTLPPSISWQAPPECSETTFRERLRPTNPSILVRVHIENAGSSGAPNYRGTLQLDTAKRSVESPRCDEVVRALALAGNMLLDREPAPPKPIAAPAGPASAPDPSPSADPSPITPKRKALEGFPLFVLGAGALLDGSRAMPVLTFTGMSIIGSKVALGLVTELQGRFTSVEVAPYTASLFWLSARYQVCALFFGGTPFRLGPCAGAEVGLSHGEVSGAQDAAAQTRFWSAVGPSVRAFWIPQKGHSFVVGLHVSTLFPLTRQHFSLESGPVLYTTPTVQPEVTLSLGYAIQ